MMATGDTATSKLELIMGRDGLARLADSTVMVLGVGGVGSNCVEALARGGVGRLVVVDPEWVTLPQQLADRVLLVCSEETMLAACAKQLAQQGLYRDFSWQSRGRALQTALFCRTDAPDAAGQLAGYEEELDILRERMELAERTGEEQGRQLERLRSDLSLSRSHEQDLEKTLNSVVQSQFWKLTWPMRYLVSKCRQLWHTFPLFVFLATLRRVGISGVMAQAKAKREYKKLFPGKAMPADHFATPERWERFIPFFKENRPVIYKPDFCKRIGVSGFWNKRKVWKRLA